MVEGIRIKGGAGEFEAALIAVVLDHITREEDSDSAIASRRGAWHAGLDESDSPRRARHPARTGGARPPLTPRTGSMVTLEPIDEANLAAVFNLEVGPSQLGFVARNPWSLAQALTQPDVAWPRAIVADGEVVGFLMLEIDPDDEDGQALLAMAPHGGRRTPRPRNWCSGGSGCLRRGEGAWRDRALHQLGRGRGRARAVLYEARVRAHRCDRRRGDGRSSDAVSQVRLSISFNSGARSR